MTLSRDSDEQRDRQSWVEFTHSESRALARTAYGSIVLACASRSTRPAEPLAGSCHRCSNCFQLVWHRGQCLSVTDQLIAERTAAPPEACCAAADLHRCCAKRRAQCLRW